MIDKRLITVKECSKHLGCGINQVYALCKEPDFPCLKLSNKIFIDIDALDNVWIPNKKKTMLKGV